MRKSKMFQRILAGVAAGAMACSLVLTAVPADAAKKKKAKEPAKEVDLNGTYHATLGLQTSTLLWITRMGYYEKSQNEYYGTEFANQMFCEDKENPGEHKMMPGTFVDAEIKGNGTYTVALEGGQFEGETDISQMHIATDIPMNDTIKFSDVSVNVNGRTVAEFEEGFMEDQEDYLKGGMVCLIVNHWRPELVKHVGTIGLPETATNGWTLLNGTGEENITITFTVSGFAYDNPDATGAQEEEAAEETGASSEASEEENKQDTVSGTVTTYLIGVVVGLVIVLMLVFLYRNRRKK